MNGIRKLHLYLGVFFSPCILFFAFSGGLQTFGLHESRAGSPYRPPAWVETLAEVHKNQRLAASPGREEAAPNEAEQTAPVETSQPAPRPHTHPSQTLKWFIFTMCIGLILTTLLGINLAFKYNRDHRPIWCALLIGFFLPILFLLI